MKRSIIVFLGVLTCALPCLGLPSVYAVDSGRDILRIDVASGAALHIATVPANAGTCAGLAVRAGIGVYLSSTGNDSVYTVTFFTATLIGPYGDSAIEMHGLEYVPATNTLYGASSHNGGLYEINKGTGAATLIGTTGLTSISNLGWNSITRVMYLTNTDADSLYTIDLNTGATTLVGPLSGPTNPSGLAFDPDTGTLYLIDNTTDSFYSINMATGAATLIGATGGGDLLGLIWTDGGFPVELQSFKIE